MQDWLVDGKTPLETVGAGREKIRRRDTDTEAVFVVLISQLLEFVDLVVGPQSRKFDPYSVSLDDSTRI